ncbi:hypothetical protein [Ornithinibacillus sp. 179-J 7C1 HS]|uniref:hypothetical protein n=1 Tax=Ornithinibacillus sp. 179-J 7C1 HS TaxID=3142384 RepID=UPI0039A0677D
MKKLLGILLFFLVMGVGCSNNEPAIVKVDINPDEANEEPELIEEIIEDEIVDEFIEFTVDDEVIRVNLKQIPILKAYLQGVEEPKTVIEKMKIEKLFNKDNNEIYLLQFSCQQDQCSYLLLDQSSDNTGHLVADLASFEDFIISPEESKMLLKFNRPSNQEYPLSNIVVIDLVDWSVLTLENEEIINNLFDYNWPILNASWVDDETIAISVPDSIPINSEQVEDGNEELNEVLFHIKGN